VRLEAAVPGEERRRWVGEQLVYYLSAADIGEDADGMVRLIGYCYYAIDYLDERDAKFVADMAKVVERYPVTAKQKRWLLDILNRLLR
jgi:hypothetical protein